MNKLFNEYVEKITNDENRERVIEVIEWIEKTYPQLICHIKWNQPMFTDHGTYIIGFSFSKNHIAVAPEKKTVDLFSEEIKSHGIEHSTMFIKFPWNKSFDYDLLKKIIDFNIEDKANISSFWR
ncbi:MAG: DUF1801 domain-containing protein [Candidatus Izemoplasmatales bacterium]|nr:DUF1801 domain-containing protein [Candidatus Izemoplasmatales bacterium]